MAVNTDHHCQTFHGRLNRIPMRKSTTSSSSVAVYRPGCTFAMCRPRGRAKRSDSAITLSWNHAETLAVKTPAVEAPAVEAPAVARNGRR